MSKKKGNPDNLRPVRSKDEAKERGKVGGQKSGEARRKKRDAKNAIQMLLDLSATGVNTVASLEALGIKEGDQTNMMALQASLFVRALNGDNSAYKMLMDYGGFNPETKIKEKESAQKVAESKAKVKFYEEGGGIPDPADPEGKDDVIIYLPEEDEEGK